MSVFTLVDLWPWMRNRWRITALVVAIFVAYFARNILIRVAYPGRIETGLETGPVITIATLVFGSSVFTGVGTVIVLAIASARQATPAQIGLAGGRVAFITVFAVLFV